MSRDIPGWWSRSDESTRATLLRGTAITSLYSLIMGVGAAIRSIALLVT
jgi:hypothetical protein